MLDNEAWMDNKNEKSTFNQLKELSKDKYFIHNTALDCAQTDHLFNPTDQIPVSCPVVFKKNERDDFNKILEDHQGDINTINILKKMLLKDKNNYVALSIMGNDFRVKLDVFMEAMMKILTKEIHTGNKSTNLFLDSCKDIAVKIGYNIADNYERIIKELIKLKYSNNLKLIIVAIYKPRKGHPIHKLDSTPGIPPTLDRFYNDLYDFYKRISKEHKIPIIDLRKTLNPDIYDHYRGGGIEPSPITAPIIAKLIHYTAEDYESLKEDLIWKESNSSGNFDEEIKQKKIIFYNESKFDVLLDNFLKFKQRYNDNEIPLNKEEYYDTVYYLQKYLKKKFSNLNETQTDAIREVIEFFGGEAIEWKLDEPKWIEFKQLITLGI